ncbi:MAG: hypothetical protein QXU71_03265 [Candidatus Aenigmatarchaeota archaeon]
MGALVDNKRDNRLTQHDRSRADSFGRVYRKGIGFDFIKQIYELIETKTPNPGDIGEIILVHGTRGWCLEHGKDIGYLRYDTEIEGFLREFKFPHQKEENILLVFSDDTTKEIYSRYAESKDKGKKDGKKYTIGRFLEDVAILTGYPGCCSVCYGKWADSNRGISEHPFYSGCRDEIIEGLGIPIEDLSIEEIRKLILKGEVYPISLLVSGKIIGPEGIYSKSIERMLPCSKNCEKANKICEEWDTFISEVGDLLYPFGLEAYNIGDSIKSENSIIDAIRIKMRRIEHYKNLN